MIDSKNMVDLLKHNFVYVGGKAYKIGEKSVQYSVRKTDHAYSVIDSVLYMG